MKRICIDARFWGVKHTGIGRYVENLIDNLPVSSETEVILIVHPDQLNESKLKKFTKYSAKYHPYTFMSLIEIGWLLLKIRPSLLHVPHVTLPWFWPGKMVMTVHDLIKHYSTGIEASTHSTPIYWLKYFEYRLMVWAGFLRASHIIVPSKYWKDELVLKHHLPESKISVTYEGITEVFLKNEKDREYKSPIKRPFIVYTGNLYPHKNVPMLIEAAKQLKLSLAIVCARSVFEKRLPKSSYLHFLGNLTDREIVSLYHQAEMFVFPSLIEGFGLPGLEAMAVGLPVIAASASCLPEVYGDAALFFDPLSIDDLVAKIKQVISDSQLRSNLISKGLAQVKKYSWASMASQTWQIYQNELR